MRTAYQDSGEAADQPQSQEIDSKYRLIILAAKRAKQLQRGARPRIDIDPGKHKFTRIALEEVIQGKVRFHVLTEGELGLEGDTEQMTVRSWRESTPFAKGLLGDAIAEMPGRTALAGGLDGDSPVHIPRRPKPKPKSSNKDSD
jgi:DNA-directed RNA polymerase subunit omega